MRGAELYKMPKRGIEGRVIYDTTEFGVNRWGLAALTRRACQVVASKGGSFQRKGSVVGGNFILRLIVA
jgi:hypothetical protein